LPDLEIGTLDSWFVQAYYKENEPFLFVLNEYVWKVEELDKKRFIIHVKRG